MTHLHPGIHLDRGSAQWDAERARLDGVVVVGRDPAAALRLGKQIDAGDAVILRKGGTNTAAGLPSSLWAATGGTGTHPDGEADGADQHRRGVPRLRLGAALGPHVVQFNAPLLQGNGASLEVWLLVEHPAEVQGHQ